MAPRNKTIYIVRHGERMDRIDKNWQPDPSLGLWDPPLTPRGFLQAQKTGAYLTDLAKEKAALNPDFRVVIYTSPFQRCVDTTLGLAQGFHEACKPVLGRAGRPNHPLSTTTNTATSDSAKTAPLIRLEPGLSEWMSDEWFDEVCPASHVISRRLQDLAIANAQVSRYAAVDWGYKAVEQQFTYPESFNGMVARIGRTKRRLLEAIRKETEEMEEDKEVVVILVTHACVVNALLESFKEEPTLLETEYCCLSKGQLTGLRDECDN
ncbi:histidine phosphatase superfamily [Jimgerdemannia flammicorona]|uniref:Histidine phosphatase superfamily n=1 Tax=Jimgerdemannia flammicorona TaxID=994334 RepID=A0A433QCY7_9FUNG|nr:histidine phosphatase superfamily [Jimgerdemannia flammicorona]